MVWRYAIRRFSSGTQKTCIELTGGPISIESVVQVARNQATVQLSSEAKSRIERSRMRVETCVDSGRTYYGINTGFGSLVSKSIDQHSLDILQTNLIRSHASGAGAPLDRAIVRSMLLCLVASLSRGLSGVRLQVVEHVIELLNKDFIPVVPSIGSVGASGDLAPLAHAMQVLMGEGEVTLPNTGEVVSGAVALELANLPKMSFVAKEGLGLINGTHLMCGSASLICDDFIQLFKAALCACSLSLEAQQASHGFLDPRINDARVFGGGKLVAQCIRNLVKDSEIHADRRKYAVNVQDPYSIRCVAPVLGAAWEAYLYARQAIETELGAVTDNPLVFESESGDTDIVSAGNFHGMPVALPLDMLSIAITHVAGMSERRTNLMISDPNTPMLAINPGVESGLMITQYTQAACMNELHGLAAPASVCNVPTCANVEDYNSWGPRGAAKARRSIELAQYVLAAEFLAGAEKIERRRPSVSGQGVEEIHRLIRTRVERLHTDRSHSNDIATLRELIQSNAFDHLVSL